MANILDRIASETELTKSERKLASIILKNPAAVVNENIADLVAALGCVGVNYHIIYRSRGQRRPAP